MDKKVTAIVIATTVIIFIAILVTILSLNSRKYGTWTDYSYVCISQGTCGKGKGIMKRTRYCKRSNSGFDCVDSEGKLSKEETNYEPCDVRCVSSSWDIEYGECVNRERVKTFKCVERDETGFNSCILNNKTYEPGDYLDLKVKCEEVKTREYRYKGAIDYPTTIFTNSKECITNNGYMLEEGYLIKDLKCDSDNCQEPIGCTEILPSDSISITNNIICDGYQLIPCRKVTNTENLPNIFDRPFTLMTGGLSLVAFQTHSPNPNQLPYRFVNSSDSYDAQDVRVMYDNPVPPSIYTCSSCEVQKANSLTLFMSLLEQISADTYKVKIFATIPGRYNYVLSTKDNELHISQLKTSPSSSGKIHQTSETFTVSLSSIVSTHCDMETLNITIKDRDENSIYVRDISGNLPIYLENVTAILSNFTFIESLNPKTLDARCSKYI